MTKNGIDYEQDYFQWLCELVQIDKIDKSYWLLAGDLHKTPFYSIVRMDENRAADGIELRDVYESEMGLNRRVLDDEDCSVLEMIIALAMKMDYQTADVDPDTIDTGIGTIYWFWDMIDNLGLTKFDDDSYYENGGTKAVHDILERFLRRKYTINGIGGLFPLVEYDRDQRKVELWYQMSAYLFEHSSI